MTMTCVLVALLTPLAANAQSADGPYVSASLVGDVLRRSFATTGGPDTSGSGEALGLALRLGSPLGRAWGVEAEFVRPSPIENDVVNGPVPLFAQERLSFPIGPFSCRVRTTERLTTLATSVWARQALSARVSLVYLAVVGFHRTSQESSTTFERAGAVAGLGALADLIGAVPGAERPGGPTSAALLPFPTTTRFVSYSTRPLVGVDARVTMTDHVSLVPSLRLHGIEAGWLLRPSVGLAWTF